MDIMLTPGYKVWSKLGVRMKTEVFRNATCINSELQNTI